MGVKYKQNEYISTFDTETQEKFNQHLRKIISNYDRADDDLFKLKPLCPICAGRQKFPDPFNVECPCREAFSQVLYFRTLLNHTKDEGALPREGLYNLPRVVLFRSDLRHESHKTFLFYWAVKCNLYNRHSMRKKVKRRNFEDIVECVIGRGEDKVEFPEYLSYVFLDSIRLLSDLQESFIDGVLASFVETRYAHGKSVWLYQSLDSEFKFPQFHAKVESVGKIITWGNTAKAITPDLSSVNRSKPQSHKYKL